MPRSMTKLAQLVGGLALILVAIWIVVFGGPDGTDPGAARGGDSSPSVAASATPGEQPSDGGETTEQAPGNQQTPVSGLDTIPESQLPPEGRETLELIRSDGPFPYDRDGIAFQNREGILPDQSRGYYREYTVPTPGEDDRGARRIVGGQDGDRYYTDDHYASFAQIEEGQ